MNAIDLKTTYEQARLLRGRIRTREVELAEIKDKYLEIADRLVIHGMYELGIGIDGDQPETSDSGRISQTRLLDSACARLAPHQPPPPTAVKTAIGSANGAAAKRQYRKKSQPDSAAEAKSAVKPPFHSGSAAELTLLAIAHLRAGSLTEIAAYSKVKLANQAEALTRLKKAGYIDRSDEEGWFITDEGDELAKSIRGEG